MPTMTELRSTSGTYKCACISIGTKAQVDESKKASITASATVATHHDISVLEYLSPPTLLYLFLFYNDSLV